MFTTLTANFCISSPDISGNLAAMFLKVKTQPCSCLTCCTIDLLLLYHHYAEIVMLSGNQSHLRNFSAYIIKLIIIKQGEQSDLLFWKKGYMTFYFFACFLTTHFLKKVWLLPNDMPRQQETQHAKIKAYTDSSKSML